MNIKELELRRRCCIFHLGTTWVQHTAKYRKNFFHTQNRLHHIHCHFGTPLRTSTMGYPFDYAPDRPEHIDAILNGLDRYNPETTAVFQDYVMQQCENQTYDCYANLALLKLYVLYFYALSKPPG